ncbi:MAG: PAS domain S-box protein [Chitinophagaceae bacterium]|nr:PAS domain S-box protein [Chitinophagaceae bacterium]
MTFEATSAGHATNRNRDQSGSLLADSLNSLNDGFLVFDSGMNYVFANVAGARMLGYAPSSLIGKNFKTAHPEWNNTVFEKSCNLVLLNEQSIVTDIQLVKEQPTVVLRIFYSPPGITVQMQKSGNKIKTEPLFPEKTIYLQNMLEGLKEGFIAADLETKRLVMTNPAFCEMLGYSLEEIMNLTMDDLHTEQELARVKYDVSRMMQGFKEPGRSIGFFGKDKTMIYLDASMFKMEIDGKNCVCGIFRVSSERKTLESNKRLSEEVRRIAELGYWENDLVNHHLKWSDETFRIFGFKPGEFTPNSEIFMEFVHPDDRQRLNDAFQKHLESREPYNIVYRIITPDRKLHTLNERCHTYYDDAGNPLRSMGVVADISYLKDAENNATVTARQYRMIFESSSIGMVAINDKGILLYANSKFVEMTGYSLKHIPSVQAWWKVAYPDPTIRFNARRQSRLNFVKALRERKRFQPFESEVLCRNGETKSFEIGYSPGASLHMISLVDVTAYKKVQKDLFIQEQRLSQLAAHSNTYAWEVNTEGLYTYVSDVVEKVMGYTPAEIIGKRHFYDYHPKEGFNEFREMALAVMQSRVELSERAIQFVHKDGHPVWLSAIGIPLLSPDGTLLGYRGSDTDITERKKAEEALRQSEETFRQIADNINEVFWLRDASNQHLLYINPAYEKVFGRSRESLYQDTSSFLAAVHPDDQELVIEKYKAYYETHEFNLECRVVHPSGEIRWLKVRATPVKDESGQITGHVGIAVDLTERKKAEEALRQSEEVFRQIADNVNEVLWLRDASNKHLLYINPSYEKVFGRTCKSLYQDPASFLTAVHTDDMEMVIQHYKAYYETHEFDLEFRILRPSGEIRWLKSKVMAVKNEAGEITGHAGLAVDFTDRKGQDDALKKTATDLESNNILLTKILNSLPDLVWLKDKDGKYLRCNKRFESFLGKPANEIIGQTDFNFFKPEVADFFREHDKAAIKNNGPLINEEWINFADGHSELLETTKTPMLDSSGKPMGVLGIGHDITKRKIAEDELRMERDLFSEGPVFTISWSPLPDWPIKYVSENVFKILGYTPEELMNPRFKYQEYIHPDDQVETLRELVYNIENNINIFEQSYRLRKYNGEYLWLYDFTQIVRDEKNEVQFIRSYLFDQTQKKELESELFEKNKQLNLIVQNIPGAVFSFSNLNQGNFMFISSYIETITGYSPGEFREGQSLLFNQLVHHDDLPKLKRVIKKAYAKGKNYSHTYRIRHRDGRYRWVYETGEFQSFGNKTGEIRIDGIIFDMTDKINSEEEKMNSVFQAADSERTRIAREIHDGLQQTLVASKLNFEMLKEEIGQISERLQKRYQTGLQFIEQAVQESRNISHSLMPKQVEEFGLVVAVENLIHNLDGKIDFKFFHDEISLGNNQVSLNLYRIIQEALNNIVKHAGASTVHINLNLDKKQLHLTIEDDGHGFRMDDAAGPDRGIGLQSMKSRAASIGANLEMYSEPGKGTLIIVDMEIP